jgi:hypothetical protein
VKGSLDILEYTCWKIVVEGESNYDGIKMLSQIYFFKIVQLSTFTKLILKEVFINYTQNKVVQFSNNAIVKEQYSKY